MSKLLPARGIHEYLCLAHHELESKGLYGCGQVARDHGGSSKHRCGAATRRAAEVSGSLGGYRKFPPQGGRPAQRNCDATLEDQIGGIVAVSHRLIVYTLPSRQPRQSRRK
jgi:hypothetical protein